LTAGAKFPERNVIISKPVGDSNTLSTFKNKILDDKRIIGGRSFEEEEKYFEIGFCLGICRKLQQFWTRHIATYQPS
jgi:hypothetical protein